MYEEKDGKPVAAFKGEQVIRNLGDLVEAVRECDRILVHVADSRRVACELQYVESTAVA